MNGERDSLSIARANAPYLAESLTLFPDLAARFQAEAPQDVLDNLFANLPQDIGDIDVEMARLRVLKRQVHLITALSDIANIWEWETVTAQLTRLSDVCMDRLIKAIAIDAGIDGTPDNPAPGLFILAVGKYGAGELNYSSDIDFNVFYDPDRIRLPNMARAERTLIKFVQKLIAGFERYTEHGYIFRTDLRLRPDPRSNAIAVSTLTAERYYESLGQNWERAAMIKARVCGGDKTAGQEFIDNVLTPFIWRRNLDYAAIEDIHSIKRQIHAGKGGQDIKPAGHHLKLGKGGIREIEFYAQVQQLILGGRHPDLRTPRTVDALSALSEAGFSDQKDTEALTGHYGFLRKLEHAAQMIRDEQTHTVPAEDPERLALSRLAGFDDLETFDTRLGQILQDVHQRYVDLFPDADSLSSEQGSLVFTGVEPDPATLETFARLGFTKGPDIWQIMAGWLGGRIPATKTERARELLTRLAPELIDICARSGKPDEAFEAFRGFFEALAGGVSLLSMFTQTPERLAQIIDMMVSSERVAQSLAAKPAILDAMVDPNFLAVSQSNIRDGFAAELTDPEDFEAALNAARRRTREDHFRISAGTLLGTLTTQETAPLLTQIADSAMTALLPAARDETERRYGPLGGDYAVLGLGKLGGREMSLTSDLDLMMVYRPLSGDEDTRKFSKLTQTFISALSAVTEEGAMFEVDMALRPSGRAGPVAVSLDAFSRYYAEKAWTWEFMALSRARVVAASSQAFAVDLAKAVRNAVMQERADLDMPSDIRDMLSRVKREKQPRGSWDIKNMDGGLRDVEFAAQSAYLQNRMQISSGSLTATADMIDFARNCGSFSPKEAAALLAANSFYHRLIQAFAITHGSLSGEMPTPLLETIATLTEVKNTQILKKQMAKHQSAVAGIVARRIG